jgi:hypothetical protein
LSLLKRPLRYAYLSLLSCTRTCSELIQPRFLLSYLGAIILHPLAPAPRRSQSHGRGLCITNGKASCRLVRFVFGRCWGLFVGWDFYCWVYVSINPADMREICEFRISAPESLPSQPGEPTESARRACRASPEEPAEPALRSLPSQPLGACRAGPWEPAEPALRTQPSQPLGACRASPESMPSQP